MLPARCFALCLVGDLSNVGKPCRKEGKKERTGRIVLTGMVQETSR
jgi:hypothetical protein